MTAGAYCRPLFHCLEVGRRRRLLGAYELVGPKVKACALGPADPVSVARDAGVRAGIDRGTAALEMEIPRVGRELRIARDGVPTAARRAAGSEEEISLADERGLDIEILC